MTPWTPPVDRWGFEVPGTFARATITHRWPIILKDTADAVADGIKSQKDAVAQEEGRKINAQIGALAQEVADDAPLRPIPQDNGSNIKLYNDLIEEYKTAGKDTWHKLPWLFAECYLYRIIRSFFATSTHWKSFDPYFEAKKKTFASSSTAVVDLATTLLGLSPTPETLQPIFHAMLQTSLWGNATDLSLLAGGATEESLKKLQSRGAEEAKMILRNDEAQVWDWVQTKKDARLDIVLDNSGFELYTDMIFADFLITHTPFFKDVVFHCKSIPWFVSDVMPNDFRWTIETLLDPSSIFPSLPTESHETLKTLAKRWKQHFVSGRFSLSVPPQTKLEDIDQGGEDFWTNPLEYQRMREVDPALVERLSESGLVIFKGDLNYRKLTADAKWEPTAKFEEVLGPLNGAFPILSLRTNKAEVIVGLQEGVAEKTEAEDPKWRVNGKYAVLSFAPSA